MSDQQEKTGSGLGKKVLGLFFTEGGLPPAAQTTPGTNGSQGASAAVRPGVSVQAKPTEDVMKLAEKLKAAALSRPSAFTQLLDQLDALSEVGLDESKQYKAAFATLKKGAQISAQDVLTAIDKFHIGMLESEQNQFDSSIGEFLRKNVVEKEKEAKLVANQTEEKLKQIAQLQSDVSELKARQEQVESDIASQAEKAERRKAEFGQAKQAVSDWLSQFKNRVSAHLGQ